MSTFSKEWLSVPIPIRRCLELAHIALLAGGLPVGAVVIDASGAVVAEGRNRAYDLPTGTDPLEATPLAHAEMNAMARLVTGSPSEDLTLWSTQQPCSMCAAAAGFIGISNIEAIATDPSNPAAYEVTDIDSSWVVLATTMFMVGRIRRRGTDEPAIAANLALEPEAVQFAVDIAKQNDHPLVRQTTSLDVALEAIWAPLTSAARLRDERLGRSQFRL